MQTLILTLPTPVLLVWGLPEDAELIGRMDDQLFSYWSKSKGWGKFNLNSRDWQLIGKLSELTEEQASTIVGKNYWDMSTGGYIDYNSEDPTDNYTFALESFHSAVDAQSKTLPANTLIFKRS